ncbi:MAG TPA: HAMP domain-containing sensor histidine kinase [Chthoniobacteraceae bacterium]|nr:HAMP domain-containing sensor histidine kinase [Chthoniobacteraceae bacterium]
MFPWEEKLQGMVQGTADALLERTAQGDAPPARKPAAAKGQSGDIQLLLSDAWLVRNSFLRALNRFQGEQSGKKVDFTAIEMTEARQEALQEFDRQISAALSDWITGSSSASTVPADSVRDLLHGLRAIQGLLQMAADTIPQGAKAHVAAAAQQLTRLANSTQELIEGGNQPEESRTGMAMASPHAAAPKAAAVALAVAPLDVPSFVRVLADAARPAAQKRGLRVECLCNPGPQMLKTDGAKLHRAATLLIDYAISLTEEGQVTIVSDRDADGAWTLEIRDSSAGIPPAMLAKLLRGVAHAPENAAGLNDSSLGIALARDLVELLGGHLEATSDPGEGNCFVIVMPMGEKNGKR